MADVFISYSRRDEGFVRRMHEALKAHGLDSWVDWEDIPPTADWLQEIYAAIEAADTFVAVLSPDSVLSETCKLEVQRAAHLNKRIVPVVCRDVDPRVVSPELARHNWLVLRENDSFDEGISILINAIETDLDWVRMHTRLLIHASEWETKRRDSSFLLRGAELREAEAWLAQASADKSPEPTPVHASYILASRKTERKQLRILTGSAILAMIIAIALAFYALSERNAAVRESNVRATAEAVSAARLIEAERQQGIALSRQLAAQALSQLDTQFDLSLLLSVEANRVANTVEAKGSLLEAIQYNPRLLSVFRGHEGGVGSVATTFSLAATAGFDNNLIIWDPDASQQLTVPIKAHSGPVVSVAFSSNAQTLASGDADGSILLWSIGKGMEQPVGPPLKGKYGGANKLAFSPDGNTLMAFGSGREVTLWDLAASPPISRTEFVQAQVHAAGFTLEGKAIAAASWDRAIVLWDVTAGEPIGVPLLGHTSQVTTAAFSADGKRLVTGASDGSAIVWDIALRRAVGEHLIGAGGAITSLAISPDDKLVAGASHNDAITLWDIDNGQPIAPPLRGHSGRVTSLAFTPDGEKLISGSGDKTAIVWSVWESLSLHQSFEGGTTPGSIFSVAFSPDGETIASGNNNNNVTSWNIESHMQLAALILTRTISVRSVAFSPDGKWVASGSEDKSVVLLDMTLPSPTSQSLSAHKGGVMSVAFSPNGKLLASGSRDKSVILWDVATQKPITPTLEGHKYDVSSVSFSPDGKMLASASWDRTVILWDAATHKQLGEPLKGHTKEVWSVAFSPDGKLLASAGEDKSIILWDVARRVALGQPLLGHSDTINSLAFSPDGKLLASGSADGTIRLWDVATRQPINPPLIELPLPTDPTTGAVRTTAINSITFSPDGKYIASGGTDAPVLWDVSLESWEKRACKLAARNFTTEEWSRYMGEVPYRETCTATP